MGEKKRPWKFFLKDYQEESDFSDFEQGGSDDDDADDSTYEYGQPEDQEWLEQRTTIPHKLKVEKKAVLLPLWTHIEHISYRILKCQLKFCNLILLTRHVYKART